MGVILERLTMSVAPSFDGISAANFQMIDISRFIVNRSGNYLRGVETVNGIDARGLVWLRDDDEIRLVHYTLPMISPRPLRTTPMPSV